MKYDVMSLQEENKSLKEKVRANPLYNNNFKLDKWNYHHAISEDGGEF